MSVNMPFNSIFEAPLPQEELGGSFDEEMSVLCAIGKQLDLDTCPESSTTSPTDVTSSMESEAAYRQSEPRSPSSAARVSSPPASPSKPQPPRATLASGSLKNHSTSSPKSPESQRRPSDSRAITDASSLEDEPLQTSLLFYVHQLQSYFQVRNVNGAIRESGVPPTNRIVVHRTNLVW